MNGPNKAQYVLPDGRIATFNRKNMRIAILRKRQFLEKSGERLSQQALLENIAAGTGISFSSIKHWSAGHNAPSDIDKVRNLAAALDVDTNYLLETETEETSMNTKIDIAATNHLSNGNHDAIRNIYAEIVEYIEMFRMIGEHSKDGGFFMGLFQKLYQNLMHLRLDIPRNTFNRLSDFMANYLQQFCYYLEHKQFVEDTSETIIRGTPNAYLEEYTDTYLCTPSAPWVAFDFYVSINPTGEFCDVFNSAFLDQYKWDSDENVCGIVPNEILVDRAYACIEEILENYRAN